MAIIQLPLRAEKKAHFWKLQFSSVFMCILLGYKLWLHFITFTGDFQGQMRYVLAKYIRVSSHPGDPWHRSLHRPVILALSNGLRLG
jgi:hypothetical protein